jgi:two-component system osmolarity sensor histidine kinase EnvZ
MHTRSVSLSTFAFWRAALAFGCLLIMSGTAGYWLVTRPSLESHARWIAAELIPAAGTCSKDVLQSQINLLRERGLTGISLETDVANGNRPTAGLIYPLPFDALLARQIQSRANTPVEALSSLGDVRVRFVCGRDPVRIGFDREKTLGAVPNQALFLWLSALLAGALVMAVVLSNSLAVPMRRLAEHLRTTPLGSLIASPVTPGTGISELDALSAEIHSLRLRANRAVANRSALLMGLSHDLRKPLARIRLILDTVTSPNMDDAQEMRRDVLELQDALDEFMRAANAMASPTLADGALQSWYRLRRLYPDQRVTFVGAPDETTPPLNTAALIRVASNLIDNALRHTEGPVQVIWSVGGKWMLCVDDGGPGIDAAHIVNACSPFFTGSHGNYEHAGLGLALASMICEHNGWVLDFGTQSGKGWRVCVKPN